jgi:hypothetical protein
MTQHTPFVERLRSALGHQTGRLATAARSEAGAIAQVTLPAQRRGVEFAERLRAALPKR